jgi:hypothetical protein
MAPIAILNKFGPRKIKMKSPQALPESAK